mgnify:CR=1 FL=1
MVKADSLKVEEAISKHLTSENDKGVDELSGIIITGELLPDNEAIPAEEQKLRADFRKGVPRKHSQYLWGFIRHAQFMDKYR